MLYLAALSNFELQQVVQLLTPLIRGDDSRYPRHTRVLAMWATMHYSTLQPHQVHSVFNTCQFNRSVLASVDDTKQVHFRLIWTQKSSGWQYLEFKLQHHEKFKYFVFNLQAVWILAVYHCRLITCFPFYQLHLTGFSKWKPQNTQHITKPLFLGMLRCWFIFSL
jgi:hypothetical protein